jgi:hypothetical protein
VILAALLVLANVATLLLDLLFLSAYRIHPISKISDKVEMISNQKKKEFIYVLSAIECNIISIEKQMNTNAVIL